MLGYQVSQAQGYQSVQRESEQQHIAREQGAIGNEPARPRVRVIRKMGTTRRRSFFIAKTQETQRSTMGSLPGFWRLRTPL